MTQLLIEKLLNVAWLTRKYAIARKTKVGAAVYVLSKKGVPLIRSGCNIEHDYCRSYHAEEVAIMNVVSLGYTNVQAIAIVAKMARFTPCGTCRDWLSQFMVPEGLVIIQSRPYGPIVKYTLKDLYPVAPIKK